MEKDYRKGQKVITTFEIFDAGQDFIELDVLENGVLLGDSVMFKNGRLSLVGIGTLDGMTYHTREEVLQTREGVLALKGMSIYMKETGQKDPLPWKATILNYRVIGQKKAKDVDRFIESAQDREDKATEKMMRCVSEKSKGIKNTRKILG